MTVDSADNFIMKSVKTIEDTVKLPGKKAGPIDHRQDPPRTVGVSASPLSPEHYKALEKAKRLRRRIDRAIGVSTFNGWCTALFAALGAPFAVFSITTLVMCAGLGAIAFHEFKGRRMLRELNPAAPRLLGVNQLAFAGLLIVYSVWNIYLAQTQPSPYADVIANQTELAGTLGSVDELYKSASLAVYGCLIAVAFIFQGGMALFYFRRTAHVRAYVDQTPRWILDMHQKTTCSPDERPLDLSDGL